MDLGWNVGLLVFGLFAAIDLLVSAKNTQDVLKSVLFGLVTWAEREYGGGTGALKLAAVIERLYPRIPVLLRGAFGVTVLEGLIDSALKAAKLKWEKNPKLISEDKGDKHE